MRNKNSQLTGAPAVVLHGLVRRWRKARPRSGGWWLWREGGRLRIDTLLLTATGLEVASDDDWHQATGRKPENDAHTENYWEGTATTQKMMPGLWMKAPNDQSQAQPPTVTHERSDSKTL